MGINRDSLVNPIRMVEHDVGGLPSHSRKREELLHCTGHASLVIVHKRSRSFDDMGGLRVKKTEAPDDLLHLFLPC
ncbi:MAG: hypothetical protein A4E42_00219 [Methanoregulaceae archaeon PtaU1.Bin222]|nr:MAG: hypothetical protein A4E42_00219 [Methanoregulaceae archaeon PtaU1.Bin222]